MTSSLIEMSKGLGHRIRQDLVMVLDPHVSSPFANRLLASGTGAPSSLVFFQVSLSPQEVRPLGDRSQTVAQP